MKKIYLLALLMLSDCLGAETDLFSYTKDVPFAQYIADTKARIKQVRESAGMDASPETVDNNAPFEMRGIGHNDIGVLITHGYLTSPYEMRDMAKVFASRGYLVRAILLPGHGTVRDDLLKVSESDWKNAVDYGIESLKKDGCKKIILYGNSTGGALSILAADQRKDIDALVLTVPLVKISPMAFLSKIANFLGMKWYEDMEEITSIRYESNPWRTMSYLYDLTKEIDRYGGDVTVPLFLAVSEDDTTLVTQHSVDLYKKSTNPLKDLILYNQEMAKKSGILAFSHLGVHVSPDNPILGIKGTFKSCIHYQKDPKKFDKCKKGQGVYGEISKEMLEHNDIVMRTTFNPQFDELAARLNTFLDKWEKTPSSSAAPPVS